MGRHHELEPARLAGDPFWAFARAMLRYRGAVALSLLMAVVSALTLSLGLAGAHPVLRSILGEGQDLPTLARGLNERLSRGPGWIPSSLRIPDAWIGALPAGDPFVALVWIMAGLAVLTFVGAGATFAHAYFSLTVVNRTVTLVRSRAFRAVLDAPLRRVVTQGPTDFISRIVGDSQKLTDGLTVLLSKTVISLAKGLAGLVMAFVFDWRVAGVALLGIGPLYIVIRKLGKRIRRASTAALESQATLLSVATQTLQALRVVKASDTQAYEAARFHRENKRMLRELNRMRTARAVSSPLTEALTVVMLCAMVLVAGKAILAGKLQPENVILAIASLAVAGAAMKPLTALAHDIQTTTPAAERLRTLIASQPEPGLERALPRLSRHTRSVELRDVTVTYPGRDMPALRAVSMTIPHGQRWAIVGPNGSGKTTVLSLVNRMFDPDQGAVLVDGVDVRTVRVRSLRRQVGVVSQETVLFRGTIRENIAYGAGATDAEVVLASRRARAHDFIASLPKGYDTPVAEQGLSLSGGQRQRIAIARAILRDPAILLLDEATSMVDADSEAGITAALAEFSRGRTTLIVAHRLSTVMGCDRIVVLDRGAVMDAGTHDDLLQRCRTYQDLARTQFVERTHDAQARV